MKNLKIYGVQEMSTQEMKKTDGGFLFILAIAAIGWGTTAARAAVVAGLAYIIADDVAGEYERGYEAGNN